MNYTFSRGCVAAIYLLNGDCWQIRLKDKLTGLKPDSGQEVPGQTGPDKAGGFVVKIALLIRRQVD